MTKKTLLSIVSLCLIVLSAPLKSFYDTTGKIGFRDSSGETIIQPQFDALPGYNSFSEIISVAKLQNGKYHSMYCNRDGKTFAYDSIFVSDNTGDTESEGCIRFQKKGKYTIGLLNRDGKVLIPDNYYYLSHVRNGMVLVLDGATYIPDSHGAGCNHYQIKGGVLQLLDTNGVLLIDSLPERATGYNFFSLSHNKDLKDSTVVRHKGKDGKVYQFKDFDKSFHSFLYDTLLADFTIANLQKKSWETINFFHNGPAVKVQSKKFLQNHAKTVIENMAIVKTKGSDSFISKGMFPFGLPNTKRFAQQAHRQDKYPLFDIVINRKEDGEDWLNSFSFLYTDKGFYLVEMTLREPSLKLETTQD